MDKNVIHLVVWTKFELEDDPAIDDLTPRARKEIDDYVKRTFCSQMPSENVRCVSVPALMIQVLIVFSTSPCLQVVWFKNWKSLKSVHAVEHFHVMLNHPDKGFVEEITHGDVPLIEQV